MDLGVAIGRGRGRVLRAAEDGRGIGAGAATVGGLDEGERAGWRAGGQRDGDELAVVAGGVAVVVGKQPGRLVGSHLRLSTVL